MQYFSRIFVSERLLMLLYHFFTTIALTHYFQYLPFTVPCQLCPYLLTTNLHRPSVSYLHFSVIPAASCNPPSGRSREGQQNEPEVKQLEDVNGGTTKETYICMYVQSGRRKCIKQYSTKAIKKQTHHDVIDECR